MVTAMVAEACERGAGNVTVAHVVERSGISRRTFYEQFVDREACFIAAFEQALGHASERVLPAYEEGKSWRQRIRAGLLALLAFLEEEPKIGRVLVCESLAGGPGVLARRSEIVAQLVAVVDEGRGEAKSSIAPPQLTAEGVVGGVLAVIHARLSTENDDSLLEQANPLMSMIVLPYLGASAAKRELDRTVSTPVAPERNGVLLADPFKASGMRLTYRTVRVLIAVAEHPGASNRLIGETAGMTDQGQISKLLARLARIGLVQNTEPHSGKGAPNSWTLTQNGRKVAQGIRAHTQEHKTIRDQPQAESADQRGRGAKP